MGERERRSDGAWESLTEVACPFCQSSRTVVISAFGSQLLTSQRRCQACGSYFEAVRDDR